MQYQFYKGPEKEGAWKALDTATLQQRINAPRIAFTTVLSVNVRPNHREAIGEDALYQGPFYIDIDSKDILKSIKAANKVLDRLHKNGVPDDAMQIWATGKKGFHFVIPMAVFTKDSPVNKLPLAYKFMALAMNLPKKETDITVYSHGRGRMWRVPNKKRLDNGAYKVGITADELRTMTPDTYATICSTPREPLPLPTVPSKRIKYLEALYQIASKRAAEAVKPIQIYLDPETVEALSGKFPPCAQDILKGSNIDKDVGYNDKSMQIAKAIAAFRGNEAEALVQEFAENTEGDNYNTVEKRFEHTMKAVRIAASSKDYSWSCHSMLKILKDKVNPCLECPVAFLLSEQDEAIAAEAARREEETEKRRKERDDRLRAKRIAEDDGFRHLGIAPHSEPDSGNASSDDGEQEADGAGNEGLDSDASETRIEDQSIQAPVRRTISVGEIEAPTRKEIDDDEEVAAEELADAVAEMAGGSGEDDPPPPESDHGEFDEDEDQSTSELTTVGGYGLPAGDGEVRQVTNFTLRFRAVFVEFIENLEHDVRTGVKADVMIDEKRVGRVILEDSCWNSKSNFISHFSGIGHTAFLGKDEDVQRLKGYLMKDIESRVENIRRVTSIGIHRTQVGDQDVFTYVEPGWSVNSIGMSDTFQLMGQIPAAPKLKVESLPLKGDSKLTSILYALSRINSDDKIAQILGWFGAAYLKQHIYTLKNQFPLMGFAGAAGSGKTSQATLFSYLHGIDYRGEAAPVSLPQATAFAVWKAIKDTTTIPRIMEEYNKSKIPRHYTAYGEVFKDCWNQFAVQRGAISNSKRHGDNQIGAHLQEFPLTAPVIVMSEQKITMPALIERMVQIDFSKRDLDEEGARDYYDQAVRGRLQLKSFAKAAYMTAIQTPLKQVSDWLSKFEPEVPMDMGDRPHFTFCVLLVGLEFLKLVCKTYDLDVVDRLTHLQNAIKSMVKDDILRLAVSKQRTEVDIVMDKFATMAAMSEGEGAMPWLVEHIHYLRDETHLYIDGLVALAQYRQFMNRVENSPPVIEEISQMKALLRTEPYCDSLDYAIGPDFARGRKVWKLDIAKMAEKGIEVSAFVPGD